MSLLAGLRSGRKKTGTKAVLVPATTVLKALPAGSREFDYLAGEGHTYGMEVTQLGELGRAQPGSSLTLDQIRELQAMR